jgi:hypothetical protein
VVATVEHADVIAIALQVAGDQFAEGGVVFDEEDVGHGCIQRYGALKVSSRERIYALIRR